MIHCLAFPLIVVLLPSLAVMQLDNEAFHTWMLVGVIPSSLYSLTMGCKQHKRYRLLVLGVLGLFFLTLAAVLGEGVLGELHEKILTVVGASIIAIGHYWNYRLCQNQKECSCSEQPGHEST
jgi:hypothetical protein